MFAKIRQKLLGLQKKFAPSKAGFIFHIELVCRNQARVLQRSQVTVPFVMNGFDHRNQGAPVKVIFAPNNLAAAFSRPVDGLNIVASQKDLCPDAVGGRFMARFFQTVQAANFLRLLLRCAQPRAAQKASNCQTRDESFQGRWSIGMTFLPTGSPTYSLRGRNRRLSSNCSRIWAHHPEVRAIAKTGVKRSVGIPNE